MKPAEHAPAQVLALQKYVNACLKRLKLRWRVRVSSEFPPSPERDYQVFADITPGDRFDAVMRVCRGFFRRKESWRRRIIAHELAHLIVLPISSFAEAQVVRVASRNRRRVDRDRAVSELDKIDEKVVQHLEGLLAELLPPCPGY